MYVSNAFRKLDYNTGLCHMSKAESMEDQLLQVRFHWAAVSVYTTDYRELQSNLNVVTNSPSCLYSEVQQLR